jgi:hypothetical protein
VDTPLSSPVVLLANVSYRIAAHFSNVDFFWSWSLPSVFQDGTIDASWSGSGDAFPTTPDDPQWYFVDIRYSTNAVAIPVSPGQTSSFNLGAWSGSVAVLQAATNVRLFATTDLAHSGESAAFDVSPTPKLGISPLSSAVVLSWPTAASGFSLKQSTDLVTWSPAPGTPTVVGDRYNVTNTISGGHIYYRLQKP